MTPGKHPFRRKVPALIGGAFLLLCTVGVVLMVKNFIANADKPAKPKVQQISLVKPPPPKELPKPPEPEKMEPEPPKDEVVMDEQTPPTPDQPADEGPPPGEQLGLDAEGGAGGDAFGLAARKGGRDITSLGGGGGSREGWYGRLISRHLEDGLKRSKRLQGNSYQVVVQVWFDAAGGVQRVRLAQGSGNADLDGAIRDEIQSLPPLREALPGDLPQPVQIRVASRA